MKQKWTNQELEELYTILPEEIALLKDIREKTSPPFAALVVFYRNEKRFPKSMNEISKPIAEYICTQLGFNKKEKLIYEYDLESKTASRHRGLIRDFFSFREATHEDKKLFEHWLIHEKLHLDHRYESLEDSSISWFHNQKVEVPAENQLGKIIRASLNTWENNLFNHIFENINEECKVEINNILNLPEEKISEVFQSGIIKKKREKSGFALIKDDPGRIGIESLISEIEKFDLIKKLICKEEIFKKLSQKVLKKYKQRISPHSAYDFKRHPEKIKYPLMSMFCFVRNAEVTDSITDLLIQLIHKITSGSERKVEKELVAEFKKKVSGKDEILYKMSQSSLDSPTEPVEEVIFPVVGKSTLEEIVKQYKEKGTTYHEKVHHVIRNSYKGHYRRMVPMIFKRLEFRSNNDIHKPVIDGINLLKSYIDEKNRYFTLEEESKIDSILKKSLRKIIVEEDEEGNERINRISFEICLLQALRDGLRCREIWVVGANRYRNPDEDLPDDFDELRDEYYDKLKLPKNAKDFIEKIKQEMEKELRILNKNMQKNKKVKILEKNNGWICLTPLEEQDEPKNLKLIQNEIFKRWKQTSLLDVLKETDLRVNFTDDFKTTGTQQYLEKSILQRRLLSCLFSMGTNTGLSRVSSLIPGEMHHELIHVKKTYLTKEQLREAITKVNNATFAIRLEKIWGDVTVSLASDSKKFGSWAQNLMVEHHIRYGGRGVMIYWHVEKNSVCIYSQLKSCSSSEVSAMIEGVLRHCTDMQVEKQFVDSHGQSEVAFAFTHLLGFQLMPRLKRIHVQKLYLPNNEMKTELGNLTPILTRQINWDLIEQQYDQMVKYATALRLGTAETESILKRFTRNGIKHPTYHALAELGKAIKTIFLCRYLNSEELRQEIHAGLNVIERWNSVNGFIFYGKNSEFSSNRLEEQELSVLALHLLQSSLVYINTLMIQDVLSESYWFSLMQKDDFRAITPLLHRHVNPYGKFTLDMNLRIPLKDVLSA